MQANIDQLMEGQLGEWLAGQSQMREDAKAKAWNHGLWSGGAAAFVLAFIWIVFEWSGPFSLFVSIAILMGVAAFTYWPIATATKEIKVGINSAIARAFGIDYEHDIAPGAEFDAARTYSLLPSYERRSTEDHWFGDLEGHRFSLYEAHLEVQRGSDKNRRWVTVFRGAIISMGFGRNFTSTTLLQRAGKHKKWLGLGGKKDEVSFKGHILSFVDQVHPEFEDTFDVYSDDQVEARVLIHPSYIEQLIRLEQVFDGDAVRALFHKGEVIIAVESKRLFESGGLDASRDREKVAEAAEQFSALARLALSINQNDRGRSMGGAAIQDARDLGRPASRGFGRKQ